MLKFLRHRRTFLEKVQFWPHPWSKKVWSKNFTFKVKFLDQSWSLLENPISMIWDSFHCGESPSYRQLSARRALLQVKDVPLRTRRGLSPYTLYSDSARAFWFSTEHLWTAITPFWLSTNDVTFSSVSGTDKMLTLNCLITMQLKEHSLQNYTQKTFVEKNFHLPRELLNAGRYHQPFL